MKTVYLSLGSNVGNRAVQIASAVELLRRAGVRVVRESPLYETEPVGLRAQRWFLNAVVEAQTWLPPRRLLQLLLGIEERMGRRRAVRNGPRRIDLDILLYGAGAIRLPELAVPHPRMAQRRFVLVPLAQLAPLLRHPVLGRTIAELLAETGDRSVVRPWKG